MNYYEIIDGIVKIQEDVDDHLNSTHVMSGLQKRKLDYAMPEDIIQKMNKEGETISYIPASLYDYAAYQIFEDQWNTEILKQDILFQGKTTITLPSTQKGKPKIERPVFRVVSQAIVKITVTNPNNGHTQSHSGIGVCQYEVPYEGDHSKAYHIAIKGSVTNARRSALQNFGKIFLPLPQEYDIEEMQHKEYVSLEKAIKKEQSIEKATVGPAKKQNQFKLYNHLGNILNVTQTAKDYLQEYKTEYLNLEDSEKKSFKEKNIRTLKIIQIATQDDPELEKSWNTLVSELKNNKQNTSSENSEKDIPLEESVNTNTNTESINNTSQKEENIHEEDEEGFLPKETIETKLFILKDSSNNRLGQYENLENYLQNYLNFLLFSKKESLSSFVENNKNDFNESIELFFENCSPEETSEEDDTILNLISSIEENHEKINSEKIPTEKLEKDSGFGETSSQEQTLPKHFKSLETDISQMTKETSKTVFEKIKPLLQTCKNKNEILEFDKYLEKFYHKMQPKILMEYASEKSKNLK